MTNEQRTLNTVEELDALPVGALVQTVEIDRFGDSRQYHEKVSTRAEASWLTLDPSDRDDGEYPSPSGWVWNTAHGFGTPREGRVVVLFTPDPEVVSS